MAPPISPQARRVLSLMRRDGYVTRLTLLHYGVANPTARFAELRQAGFLIECETRTDAMGSDYSRWRLGYCLKEVHDALAA